MSIDVRCECGKEFKVDESRVGQRGKCKCGRVIMVEPQYVPPVIPGKRVIAIKGAHATTMDGGPSRAPKINGYYWMYQVKPSTAPRDTGRTKDLIAKIRAERAAAEDNVLPEDGDV